ncbi:unnamed protein product, partial [Hymenolepis diminuta]|uniref:Nudix hydrolase domain-containing protein n=1 Tax=Hymenolepis diminuta TaxID=6216 RepID=A0A0R3SS07_HYMDI
IIRRRINIKTPLIQCNRIGKCLKVVNAIIFSKKLRHFLVVKGFYLDKWMFPGGKVKFNETDEEGVIREVKEETGLDIKNLTNKIVSFETKGEKRSFRTYVVEGIKFTESMTPEKIWEVEVFLCLYRQKLVLLAIFASPFVYCFHRLNAFS